MPTQLEWYEVLLRLVLTVAGGAALGIDRSEHSRPAGLRTVLLVCLAASLAMILANRLLITSGKAADSFVQLDMMRRASRWTTIETLPRRQRDGSLFPTYSPTLALSTTITRWRCTCAA